MNFLNPLFLFGLAAAAVPILIHLFTRKRPREMKFPSLEFLSEVNRSEIRRLRLRHQRHQRRDLAAHRHGLWRHCEELVERAAFVGFEV